MHRSDEKGQDEARGLSGTVARNNQQDEPGRVSMGLRRPRAGEEPENCPDGDAPMEPPAPPQASDADPELSGCYQTDHDER